LDFDDADALKMYDNCIYYNQPYYYIYDAGFTTYFKDILDYSHQKPFGQRDTITTLTYSDTTLTIAAQQYADSYQWYHDSLPIAGATDTALHIYCATAADAGSYTCHSIGQYFNTHSFRFNYGITEFTSEPQTVIVDPRLSTTTLATIYPTLSDGTITIKYALPQQQQVSLQVYDMVGASVYTRDIGIHPHGLYYEHIDLSDLATGTYFARIVFSQGYSRTQRIIIAR
jgi:hypothetical protein